MGNKLIIHRALLIERTNYCVDCSYKVGWEKITGRNYPRQNFSERKQGGGCTQNNTLRFRGNAREKKRKGERGSWSIAIAWSRPERSPPMVGDDRLLASRIEGRRPMNLWTFGPSWRGSMLNYEIFIRWTCVRLSKIYPLYNGIADKISCRSFLSLRFLYFLYVIDNSGGV